MDDKKVSIIVPVYNVEKYLSKCIDSIINQTYKNIEIILIDDGSKDLSGDICDDYQKRDDRIKVVHKQNGGLSSARNAGLDMMNGEFVGFIDSDDFIHPQMIEILLELACKYSLDMAVGATRDIQERDNVTYLSYDVEQETEKEKVELFDGQKALKKFSSYYYERIWMTAQHKLYSAKIFEKIRFMEGKIYEDEYSFHHIINQCEKIGIIDIPLYFYYLSPQSILRSDFKESRFDLLDATLDRLSFFADKGIQEEIEFWGNKYVGKVFEMWHLVSNEQKLYKKVFQQKHISRLKEHQKLFKKCKFNMKISFHIWLIKTMPNIENKIYKKY